MPKVPVQMLQRCRTFVFDCDGTLWNQTTLTPGVIDFILYVKKSGRRCILLTNNSRKSNEQYYEKCRKLGLPVEKSDIICVAQVAANALLKTGMQGPLYVIGEEGIAIELSKVGISSLGIGKDAMEANAFDPSELKPEIQNVLVGYDSQFNYVKCMKAATLIGRGCKFYATNEDAQLPAPDRICPGTGSVVAAVRVASGKDPIVFGKPHKAMFDYLVETAGICAEDTAMVGDRLETDMLFANNFGLLSICVLTGTTTKEVLAEARCDLGNKGILPDLVYPTLVDLHTQLSNMDEKFKLTTIATVA